MKKTAILIAVVTLFFCAVSSVMAFGFDNPQGFPLYVIIEVNWDGEAEQGDWTVWGPKWAPVVGTGTTLSSCIDCVGVDYDFTFRGKTVQFDEIYVPGVDAYPQIRHVVLNDVDGNGTYTGSLPAECYEFPSRIGAFHDRIDYEITFDENGEVTDFHYLEYEHWNQDPTASCD